MMDQRGIRTWTLYSVSCATIWVIGCVQSILTYLHCQNQSLIISVLTSCVYGNGILVLNSQMPNNLLKPIDRYKPLTSQVIESKAYQHNIAENKQLIDHKWQFIEKKVMKIKYHSMIFLCFYNETYGIWIGKNSVEFWSVGKIFYNCIHE